MTICQLPEYEIAVHFADLLEPSELYKISDPSKDAPRYCFFGDAVNIASHMQSMASWGAIQVSDATSRLLKSSRESGRVESRLLRTTADMGGGLLVSLGTAWVKGKGSMALWQLITLKSIVITVDEHGVPSLNDLFREDTAVRFFTCVENQEHSDGSSRKKGSGKLERPTGMETFTFNVGFNNEWVVGSSELPCPTIVESPAGNIGFRNLKPKPLIAGFLTTLSDKHCIINKYVFDNVKRSCMTVDTPRHMVKKSSWSQELSHVLHRLV
eukprot:gene27133-33386_t